MERLPLRVVEFYAGVGGYHYALLQSEACAKVVASVDINTNANKVYAHNFPSTLHWNRNICGITAQELDKLQPDVFFLSPPCQPFTRQGLRKDSSDRRTDSFFHLMETLPEMKSPPSYILMENVQGFEVSKTRDHFVGTLRSLRYNVQEFLLSPVQFGMPNSRLRYYLLARKEPLQFPLTLPEQPCTDAQSLLEFTSQSIQRKTPSKQLVLVKEFEEDNGEQNFIPAQDKTTAHISTQHKYEQETSTCEAAISNKPKMTDQESQVCTQNNASTSNCEVTISTSVCAHEQSTLPQTPDRNTLTSPPQRTTSSPDQMKDWSDGDIACSLDSIVLGRGEESIRADHSSYSKDLNPLSYYLELLSEVALQAYLVPEKILKKYAIGLDIVRPSSFHSCCFTKGYGNYAVGTGSVLQHASSVDLDKAFQEFLARQKAGEIDTCVQCLLPLKLRYFTPREISNLMGFPPTHSFPSELSVRQCYKVMGNSLNVHVVAVLMKYLLCSE